MNKLFVFVFLGLLLGAIVGCSGGSASAQADDKALRKQFGKAKFDINDVPQSQRAMVQGFIDRQKKGQAAGGAAH